MLKLTYTEDNVRVELLPESLEDWVSSRVKLALCAGIPLYVEPTTACFFLPNDLADLADLQKIASEDQGGVLEINLDDEGYVEIALKGTWLVSETETENGVFVTTMSDRAEWLLFKLWLEAETKASVFSD